MKHPTIATVKAFIRHNRERLLLRVYNNFDSMTDCVQSVDQATWRPAVPASNPMENNQGINGVWFVGHGGDYVKPVSCCGVTGWEVSNCCGNWAVAVAG